MVHLPWTHFYVMPNGRIIGFVPDKCEHCEAEIQAPNAIYLGETRERLLELGLIEMDHLPGEGYYSDEIGGEACYTCNA